MYFHANALYDCTIKYDVSYSFVRVKKTSRGKAQSEIKYALSYQIAAADSQLAIQVTSSLLTK